MQKSILVMLIVLMSNSLFAQSGSPFGWDHPTNNYNKDSRMSPVEVPKHFNVEGQIYEGNVSGLRDYVETVKTKNPELYKKLDLKLQPLEEKQRTGNIYLYSLGGVGLATIVYAFTGIKDPDGSTTPGNPNFGETKTGTKIAVAGVGIGIVGAGILLSALKGPQRSDIMNFLNFNNKENKESQMKFELGFLDNAKPGLLATYTF